MRIPWTSLGQIGRRMQKLRYSGLGVVAAVLIVLLGLAVIWRVVPAGGNITTQVSPLVGRSILTAMLVIAVLTCWAMMSRRRGHGEAVTRETMPTEHAFQSEVRQLEAELEANLSPLRRTLGARRYVDRLPWYLVLGGEGCGRSSLIHRSDLTFPASAMRQAGGMGAPGKDLSPDRSTHWWISDDAVLIEPSASLLFPPADATGHGAVGAGILWKGLLAWLARRRARPCINGIVLVVEFPDLATQSPSDRRARSLLLRARLHEAMAAAGGRLPVYIILSKLDLLEGFSEFFARLPRATRDETLGFTFSIRSVEAGESWRAQLLTQYESLMGRLNEQMLDALGEQNDFSTRERMFSFVRQMAGLQPALVEFLDDLTSTDRHSASPMIRGLFFSSVYQHGILFNAFVAEAAKSHDLPGVIPAAQGSEPSTVHFSRHIFRDVIYPEAGMAADLPGSSAEDARRLWRGWVPASFGLLVVVACWHHYFESSRGQVMEVLSRAEMVGRRPVAPGVHPLGIDLLVTMNELRQTASVYRGRGSNWYAFSRLGFNQGYLIGPRADAAYVRSLSREFLPALARGLLVTMEGADPGSEAQLKALRVYRMIDERENRQKGVVKDWMSDRLQSPLSGQAQARDQMMQHLDYALDHADPDLTQDRLRVSRIQANFGRVSLPERVYAGLKADVAKENIPPLRLRDVVGPVFETVFTTGRDAQGADPAIDTLFTARGAADYFNAFRPQVAGRALQDQWVIGNRTSIHYSEADKTALVQSVEGLYTSDYAGHWNRALASLGVRKFDSLPSAVTILAAVAGPEAPFRRLLDAVRANTSLGVRPASTEDHQAAVVSAVPSERKGSTGPLATLFAPLNATLDARDPDPAAYDQLIAATRRLHDYLNAIATSHDRGKAALQAVTDRDKGSEADPVAELTRLARDFPKPFGEHFVRMADASEALLRAEALAEVQREWHAEVYSFYNQRLRTRYPFATAAASDASLDDFIELFGPKGRLARFDERHLWLIAPTNSTNAPLGNGVQTTNVTFLDQRNATGRIREAFFNEAGEFGLQFSVEPLGLTPNRRNSVFELDGQLVGYSHGPSIPAGLIWPNTMREGAVSRVTLVTTTGSSQTAAFRGPWSLFRLLSQGHLASTSAGAIELAFTAGDGAVRYRISSSRTNNPFNQRLFTGFDMPRSILPPADSSPPRDKTMEESDGT